MANKEQEHGSDDELDAELNERLRLAMDGIGPDGASKRPYAWLRRSVAAELKRRAESGDKTMNKTREHNPRRYDASPREASPREAAPRQRAHLAYAIYKEGHHDRAMSELCEAFHVLRGLPGTRPYDRSKFLDWLARGQMSASTYTVACFVLSIGHSYPIFDFGSSFQNWDSLNREAFIGWCEKHWYS